MKHKYLVASLMVSLFGCSHSGQPPIIYYKSQIISLGNIKAHYDNKGFIEVWNKGETDLNITNIEPDCTCTVIANKPYSIKPKTSHRFFFTVRPAVDGYIQQAVVMDNDSKNEPKAMFLIRGQSSM